MKLNRTGAIWDRTNRNDINQNWEALENTLGNFGKPGFITNEMLAPESIGPSKYIPKSINFNHINNLGILNKNIANNTIGEEKVKFDSILLNKGKLFPLQNYRRSGVLSPVSEKIKNTILDIKIEGAEKDKVYQLDSVRYGLSGNFGVVVSSWNTPYGGSIYASSKEVVINKTGDDVNLIERDAEYPNISIMVASENGLTVTVTFDTSTIGTIVNIAENENGSGQGAIIHPSNYTYRNFDVIPGDDTKTDSLVYVDKKEKEMTVYVPSVSGYVGFGLIRRTVPYVPGSSNAGQNMDVWALDRVSGYQKNGDSFIELPNRVFIYSPSSSVPTNTMDTIFRRVGETDYSGGFYHGDEKIQSHNIFIGNSNLTDSVGFYSGASVELIQETLLYEDSVTASSGNTDAYVKVNKVHQFDVDNVYTLRTRVESLKDSNLEFSNIGAFSARRLFENGLANNFTDFVGLDSAEHINVRTVSSGNHFSGKNERNYKVMGWYKQILISYKTDSDYFDSWVRNYAENDIKLYSRIIPSGEVFEKGKIITSSVNYKFDITG